MVLALSLCSGIVLAQPQTSAPNLYGDRQVGSFGDIGTGHFGNPAVGNFDSAGVRTPPPGSRPLGRVYDGKAAEPSPYISLPEPPPEPSKAATDSKQPKPKAAGKKKPAKKRAS